MSPPKLIDTIDTGICSLSFTKVKEDTFLSAEFARGLSRYIKKGGKWEKS